MSHDAEFELLPFATETESEGAWESERHSPRRGRPVVGMRTTPLRPLPPRLPRLGSYRPHPAWLAPAVASPCVCPVHGTEYARWIQSALNQVEGLQLPIDGVMSPATRRALQAFQSRQGLPADGIAGPDTEDALRQARGGGKPAASAPVPVETGEPADGEVFEYETLELEAPSTGSPTLRRGASGSAVADLQQRLASAGFSPGPIDGLFGSQTDRAVRAFQQARRLVVDGIVGPQTWDSLNPGTAGIEPTLSPALGRDPEIEKLHLLEPARSAAYALKAKHPWVRFTSGRRDIASQASAMADNVVLNRRWIEQTYRPSPASRAAQKWVYYHPEAHTKSEITSGLLSVLQNFSPAEMGRLSYHLSGLAFDIQPVPGRVADISQTIRTLPRVKEFLTREGGLERWHVAFK